MVKICHSRNDVDRSLSHVIGLVILIGMVLIGAMVVFVAGSVMLDSIGDRAEIERAELSMLEAKGQLETVAFQDDSSTTIHVENGEIVEDGEIEFNVSGTDSSGTWHDCSQMIPFSSLVEETDSETVRYQGGGVWRTTGETSTMVSKPTLRYRSEVVDGTDVPTVQFPILTLEGNAGRNDQLVAQKSPTGTNDSELHDELCLTGEDAIERIHHLEVTIRDTAAIDAWERYLYSEFDDENADIEGIDEGEVGAVSVTVTWDHDGIDSPTAGSPETTIYGGLTAIGDSVSDSQFTVTDADGSPDWMTVDGDFAQQDGGVDGYLSVDGEFERRGDTAECPEALFAGRTDSEGAPVCPLDGDSDIESIDPIDGDIADAIATLEGADDPRGGSLDAGQYYSDDDLELEGTIDTTDGPVEIGVDSTLDLSNLEIVGDGQVRLYVTGDIVIGGESTAPESDSLWMYGTSSSDVTFEDTHDNDEQVDVTGVVYAPGDGANDLLFKADVDIEGAVVGGAITAEGAREVTIRSDRSHRTDYPVDEDVAASATLELHAHEVAEVIQRTETELRSRDVVFVLDRSGSMDPPDDVLSYFVDVYGEQYEPIYEGRAADSPLLDETDGVHRTDEIDGTPRHRLYVDDDGDWVRADRECTPWRCNSGTAEYDIPDDTAIRVTQAGFDPAGERVEATEKFIDNVLNTSLDDRAGYVDFESTGHVRHELSPDLTSVRDALTDEAGGGTDIGAGIWTGTDLYDETDADRTMVLLSDGENDGASDADTIAAAEYAAENDITIYTVGLGDAADEELLQNIADTTDGNYYAAVNAGELAATLERAADDVGDRDERYIEHKHVETEVGDGTIDEETNSYTLSPGEPQDISFISYDCDGSVSTGERDEHDGESYTHHECEEGAINESSSYELSESFETNDAVYESGDLLDEYERGWWQDGLSATLFEEDLIDTNDEFTLEENERAIVVQYEGAETPTGYAVFTLTIDRPTLPDGSPAQRTSSNTYVINIHETTITVDG